MIKVFDCLVEIPEVKEEYKETIDNIFWLSHAENVYELHGYLLDDIYLFNEMLDKKVISPKDNPLFLEVRKYLIDICETIEFILDQEVYTVDFDNEDIFKQRAEDACETGYDLYLLKAIHSYDVEWALKEFEKDTLEDPFNSMTFLGACKKALDFKRN